MSEIPRPSHLSAENAAAFQLRGVVDAYHLRMPYPPELATFLCELMRPAGGRVLELGCGTGEIARAIAPSCERVDALDISGPMLDKARSMPGGTHDAIRWIHAAAEDAAFEGPYALVVAGDALHWMNWDVVLPRVRAALGDGAHLAIVNSLGHTPPWSAELRPVIARYSVMQDFAPFDLIEELVRRDLLQPIGDEAVGADPFRRSTSEYIEGLHAMSGLPRERMGAEGAAAFDDEVLRIVEPFVKDGYLELTASARVVWGRAG